MGNLENGMRKSCRIPVSMKDSITKPKTSRFSLKENFYLIGCERYHVVTYIFPFFLPVLENIESSSSCSSAFGITIFGWLHMNVVVVHCQIPKSGHWLVLFLKVVLYRAIFFCCQQS